MKKEIYRYKGSGKKPWYQRLKDWALVKVGLLDNPGSPAEGEKERVGYKRHGLNAKKIKEQLEVQSTWLEELKK